MRCGVFRVAVGLDQDNIHDKQAFRHNGRIEFVKLNSVSWPERRCLQFKDSVSEMTSMLAWLMSWKRRMIGPHRFGEHYKTFVVAIYGGTKPRE